MASKGQVNEALQLNPAVISYIERLADVCKESTNRPLQVVLWGGEPLVYLKEIKDFIERIDAGNIVFHMSSNGGLLTPETVDFLNRHVIRYSLSNDGPYTANVRGINILEDAHLVGLFKQIHHRAVTLILTPYSQNLTEAWNYIRDKVGRDVNISTEFLMSTPDMPGDLCTFDTERFRQTMRDVVDTAFADRLEGRTGPAMRFVNSFCVDLLRFLLNDKYFADPSTPRCSAVHRILNIDLQGSVYPCHNHGDRIGDISMPHQDLIQAFRDRYDMKGYDDECTRCPWLPVCHGQCPFIAPSPNKSRCCEIRRIFYDELVRYVNMFEGVY